MDRAEMTPGDPARVRCDRRCSPEHDAGQEESASPITLPAVPRRQRDHQGELDLIDHKSQGRSRTPKHPTGGCPHLRAAPRAARQPGWSRSIVDPANRIIL
jgi:hypothetical protein